MFGRADSDCVCRLLRHVWFQSSESSEKLRRTVNYRSWEPVSDVVCDRSELHGICGWNGAEVIDTQ